LNRRSDVAATAWNSLPRDLAPVGLGIIMATNPASKKGILRALSLTMTILFAGLIAAAAPAAATANTECPPGATLVFIGLPAHPGYACVDCTFPPFSYAEWFYCFGILGLANNPGGLPSSFATETPRIDVPIGFPDEGRQTLDPVMKPVQNIVPSGCWLDADTVTICI
jgi:hypothetical protein